MNPLLEFADRSFAWIRAQPFFLRFTLFTRILLAAAFIPTGMVKVLGQRFTSMPLDTPIGAFFEAMYQTGLFWRFIGTAQVVAGVLLLLPRSAHLGAAIFLPIIVNICIITVGLGFKGTSFVTGPMLLAVLWLIAWDWHRFRGLFTEAPLLLEYRPATLRLDPLERAGFVVFAVSLLAFFGVTRSLVPPWFGLAAVATGFGGGLFTLLRFLTAGRRLAPRPSDAAGS